MTILTCAKPDRDVAALVCGYPIPCPWHTSVIRTSDGEYSIAPYTEPEKAEKLIEIAESFTDSDKIEGPADSTADPQSTGDITSHESP